MAGTADCLKHGFRYAAGRTGPLAIGTAGVAMLVSWNWLSRYVDLTLSHDHLVDRLSLSGLNHEGSQTVDGEVVIDLEVTSNRGDCLGHIGVAREIAVLTGQKLRIESVEFQPADRSVADGLRVTNQFVSACPRYTARVIRGVRVTDSPAWLVEALTAVGIKPVNNIVDVTNYVLMECGQPLHAFDAGRVTGGHIVVRPGVADETMEAIDHKTYALTTTDCVIADAAGPLAIAGVMGGAGSEVTSATTDVIVEAAIFTPLAVRRTARRLKLHSPSSFRFERRVDPAGVDWASRRACQLITQIAGGQVDAGIIDTSPAVPSPPPVTIRMSRLKSLLGIGVPADEVHRILTGLGCDVAPSADGSSMQCVTPTWRHDLTREVDLIEEIARIHGYDKIPEDAPIPVTPSAKRTFDASTSRVRGVLVAAGFSEAMTPSVVTDKVDAVTSPWTDRPAMSTRTAMLVGSKLLRRSLIPSLLHSRAANFASASLHADLFEIAHVYLPPADDESLPAENYHLGIIGGDDFFGVKGVIETIVNRLGVPGEISVHPTDVDGFARGGAVTITVGDDPQMIGVLGMLADAVTKSLKLPTRVVAAELWLDALVEKSQLVPQQKPVSPFPTINRDLNLIVPEPVRWIELASIIRSVAGERLADLSYQETYRNEQQDGPERKRILFSMELQSQTETLSGADADDIVERIVGQCEQQLKAVLMR